MTDDQVPPGEPFAWISDEAIEESQRSLREDYPEVWEAWLAWLRLERARAELAAAEKAAEVARKRAVEVQAQAEYDASPELQDLLARATTSPTVSRRYERREDEEE